MKPIDFNGALAFVLEAEGGISNDSADPGGLTAYGITHGEYSIYRKAHHLPAQSVRLITQAEVRDIYLHGYWLAAHCDKLPGPLAAVQFDCAVNMGVSRAMRLLNASLGIPGAGSTWQAATAAAVASHAGSVDKVVTAYLAKRRAAYEGIVKRRPASAKFLKGWLARVDRLQAFVKGS